VLAIAPFFALPQDLVPDSVLQGIGAHGAQLLASNLYVIVGLAVLCLAALRIVPNRTVPIPLADSRRDQLGRSVVVERRSRWLRTWTGTHLGD
jgi:hypothetical protein